LKCGRSAGTEKSDSDGVGTDIPVIEERPV
jgi:hypothetical protein